MNYVHWQNSGKDTLKRDPIATVLTVVFFIVAAVLIGAFVLLLLL